MFLQLFQNVVRLFTSEKFTRDMKFSGAGARHTKVELPDLKPHPLTLS